MLIIISKSVLVIKYFISEKSLQQIHFPSKVYKCKYKIYKKVKIRSQT